MNPGAETIQVSLTRHDTNEPWGFRLNGGIDFTTSLSVSQVNPGGVGDRCGLKAGDAVLSINDKPSDELEHEAAKYEILRSGNQVSMLIQRAAVSIWKPKVTPMSELKPHEMSQVPYGEDGQPFVQKTSLEYTQPEPLRIGSAHNRTARPFPGFGGGSAATAAPAPAPAPAPAGVPGGYGAGGYGGGDAQPGLVNAQYNTPISMYSQQNVQDSYNAHAQGLSSDLSRLAIEKDQPDGDQLSSSSTTTPNRTIASASGAKPSPAVHPSPTLLAVQEDSGDRAGRVTEDTRFGQDGYSNATKQSRSFRLLERDLGEEEIGEVSAGGAGGVSGMRSVRAPIAKPPGERKPAAQHATCQVCGSLCVGVFVKVKGQPMHPECYKCQRCGINLKQKGFIQVEGKFFCENCARQVATPPGENMVAVAVFR